MSRVWKQLVGVGVLVVGVGCSGAPPSKLDGRWDGLSSEGVPQSARAQANAFAAGTAILARGGQITIRTPSGKHGPTPYRVEREDDYTVVIRTDPGALAETFTFDSAGVMTWKIDAERSMTFKKTPSAP